MRDSIVEGHVTLVRDGNLVYVGAYGSMLPEAADSGGAELIPELIRAHSESLAPLRDEIRVDWVEMFSHDDDAIVAAQVTNVSDGIVLVALVEVDEGQLEGGVGIRPGEVAILDVNSNERTWTITGVRRSDARFATVDVTESQTLGGVVAGSMEAHARDPVGPDPGLLYRDSTGDPIWYESFIYEVGDSGSESTIVLHFEERVSDIDGATSVELFGL